MIFHTFCFWNKPLATNNILFFLGWLGCLCNQRKLLQKKHEHGSKQTIKLLMQRIHNRIRFSIQGITCIRGFLQHFRMQFQVYNTKNSKTTLHFRIMFAIIGFFENYYSCNYCKSLEPAIAISLSLSLIYHNMGLVCHTVALPFTFFFS